MNDASSRLQLNRTLLTASDVSQLSEEAVRILQTELAARTVTLFLYSKRGLLVPLASAGIVPPEANTEAYAPGEDLVGICAAGQRDGLFGKPIVTRKAMAKTSLNFQRIFGAVITPDTEVAYIPLSGPNRTYGVLRCIAGLSANGEEIRFSQDDLSGIAVYTHQVGISISNLRRKAELDVLANANKLLTDQPQKVKRIYDLVTSALVAETTPYAACSIRIRDRRGDLVLESLSGTWGITKVDKENAIRRSDDRFVEEAFSTRKPQTIPDVQSRIGEFDDPSWLRENGIVAAAVLPIYLEDDNEDDNIDNIGVLTLYLWYSYAFYDSKLEFLENLCHQVATATRVVSLLTARQQLIERMSAIISHPGTAAELLQTILDAACDLTGAWQGYIALISRRDAVLHPRASTLHLSLSDIPPIDVNGEGLTALAVRNKTSVRVGNVRIAFDYVDFGGQARWRTRSELVVPLLHAEYVLGVIALQSDQIDGFSQTDQLLIETLAQYATLVLQRDRLYDATKKLAYADFPRANRERVMNAITRNAAELVDADAVILRTYDSATRELLLESHYPHSRNVEHVPAALPWDIGASWEALRTKEIIKFADLSHNKSFQNRDFATSNGYTDMVSVPLFVLDEDGKSATDLGVVNVFFRTSSPFFDVERQLLRALSVSASYAIHDLEIIERSSRASKMATITARTAAAVELSSQLAQQALIPLREARLALDAVGLAIYQHDLAGAPVPLANLEKHIETLESLIGQLAPKDRIHVRGDHIDLLSDAFRLIHTNLFATSGRPHLNIGEAELWEEIKSALRRVIKLVRLPLATAYISSHRDYSALRRVAVTREENAPEVDTIRLASSDEFAWLADQTHVLLPREDGHLAWLDPKTFIGAPGAVLFGHEVTGGRLMIIGLGIENDRNLSFEDLATLYESVAVQIFTYVDNAMFGIELDFMTSETGHLMGRAIGKVESGTRVLKELLDSPETSDSGLTELARSAVEDGLTRLKLIHNNFYWFSAQRRFLDTGAGDASDTAGTDKLDVSTMLRDMEPMFQREARGTGLKPTRFENRQTAVVGGPEDLMRLTFLNLYDNALKFAYKNTFISIRVSRKNGTCVVEFENLGVGVAPDEVKTVFERLRRSRFRDPSRRVEGLGLGLAYCRRVVEEIFKGRIELTSRLVDSRNPPRFEGDNWLTTVTVTLPLLGVTAENRA